MAVRVLYLIDSLGPGGAQRQLVTLASGLDRARIEPTVAVYRPFWHFRPQLERSGVTVRLIGSRGAKDPAAWLRFARLVRRERYDLVHSFLRTPGLMARFAVRRSAGTRVIVSERSVDLGYSPAKLVLERMAVDRADAMIVNAEAVRRHVLDTVPAWSGRVHVVHNGIEWAEPSEETRRAADEIRAACLVEGADVLLGVVARVSREKHPHLLLDALEDLPDDVLGRTSVLWVGAPREPDLLRDVNDRLSGGRLKGRVHHRPPTRDVRSVYLAIDALVHPSRREGFPNVVLEALADGRPVVATDVGDVRALLQDGVSGWVVRSDDRAELADALRELVSLTPERRAEMGRAGADYVLRTYPSSRLVNETLAVYENVLGTAV
jgi:glycosyltransferase involved in cell wall biosynthesis